MLRSIYLSGVWNESNPDLHHPVSTWFKDEIKHTRNKIDGCSFVLYTGEEGENNCWQYAYHVVSPSVSRIW